LDTVWPEPGIVTLEGPKGEIVTLDRIAVAPERYLERRGFQGERRSVRIGSRAAFEIVSRGRAALVVPVEGEHWVLTAQTAAASALLQKVVTWLDIDGSYSDASIRKPIADSR
jgi:hypothetical protein